MEIRVFFVQRGISIEDAITTQLKEGWHVKLPIEQLNSIHDNQIRIKVEDVRFHPIKEDGILYPENETEFRTFDIFEQVGNSETGDIDIYAFAKEDD